MALSSQTASASRWKHDVFLSFRGADTRKGFISHLYHELQNRRGIKTFKDDQQLHIGKPISPNLLTAIEESRFAIIVLSENYASSTWCLDELTKIFHCMEGKDRILPLFYHVEPSDVRYLKRSFDIAFTKPEEKSTPDIEKAEQWRVALRKVANLSGWDTKNFQSERELLEDIVEFVCSKLQSIKIESTLTTGYFEAFEATKRGMDEIMKALKEDEVTVIAVVGMGGVGKTTVVKHVGAQAQKIGLFDYVIMGVITQSPDFRKIQDTFADMLGLELRMKTVSGRAIELKDFIMRRSSILIILDDIWKSIDLSSIGIPEHNELQGCNSKVLLTTRIWNVCHVMKSQAKISLNLLSEEDSWTFFVKHAGRSFESTNFHAVAKKVARECSGLPIALIAVAKALGDKYDLDEWEESARRLEMSKTCNLDEEEGVFNCIKLSYDYLKGEDAKSCFLLCCLFPEDSDIKIEDLVKYAIGIGLFQDANTMEEARGKGRLLVKYLKASSLILDSEKDGYIRIHDVIRDTALKIAKVDRHGFLVKAGCKLRQWPNNAHKGYSAISLMGNDICKLPEELVCTTLQILLLQGNTCIYEIPKAFFQTPNALRVLDLNHTRVSLLPESFSLLANLQALYLDYCKSIIDISILGKLKKLEILSMQELPLEELPKEIGELTNLRMLDITNGRVVTVPSKVIISRLHRLEDLYMQCGLRDWGTKIEGEGGETNVGFDELIGLSYLNILKVCVSDAKCLPEKVEFYPNLVYFDICISSDRSRSTPISQHGHNSRALILDTTVNTLPVWFNNMVTEKANKLQYLKCMGLNDILVEYDHGKLHGLKYLAVFFCHNLKELMNTTTQVRNKPVFENLEELHLVHLYGLKELCVGELPVGSLCNLQLLNVRSCDDLGNSLLTSNLSQRLQNLEKLTCFELNGMEYVFGSGCLEPEEIILTKLRNMRLWSLQNLIKIWNGPAPPAIFQNLKSLLVSDCENLKSLFTLDVARCLLQLEDLLVDHCNSLDTIIEASEETENNKIIVFPELKNLALRYLPQLTRFHSSTGGSATSLDIECPSLEHLYVQWCPQFSTSRTLASDFHSKKQVLVNDEQHLLLLQKGLWGDTYDLKESSGIRNPTESGDTYAQIRNPTENAK